MPTRSHLGHALPRAEVNVTPMIDVMLVLLIIVMIVTPLVRSSSVLPESTYAEPRPEEPNEIVLGIDRNGAYFLSATGEGAPIELSSPRMVSAEGLGEWLRRLYARRTHDRILYVKADKRLLFGRIEEVIEIARKSGVRVVAAVTEPRRPPGARRRPSETP